MWREGEFRLDPVWKLLVSQPELKPEDVAPPLLTFKAYERELGVNVRIPQALSAIPRGEQVRLREELGITAEDFAKAIEEMRALAASEASAAQQKQLVRAAEATTTRNEPRKPAPARAAGGKPVPKSMVAALGAVALVALVVGTIFALRDTSSEFALGDVAATLQLAKGRASGPSLTATIADPRWQTMSQDERKKAVTAVMDIENSKGIRALVLIDANGMPRATVVEGPSGRSVTVH
jgi:hypothetical protein